MKRIKDLEYKWIFKDSFRVSAYTVEHNNGKKYVIYAHDFNDMEFFLTRLEVKDGGIKTRQRDCGTHFEKRPCLSYLPDRKGNPKKKPFWYRGRIYELRQVE